MNRFLKMFLSLSLLWGLSTAVVGCSAEDDEPDVEEEYQEDDEVETEDTAD